MEQLGARTYRCTLCSVVVHVETDETPVDMIAAESGQAPERVVSIGDVEIHRCEVFRAAVRRGAVARA